MGSVAIFCAYITVADTGGIGANFVVTKSVEEQGITVVGVPAKNSNVDSKDYI